MTLLKNVIVLFCTILITNFLIAQTKPSLKSKIVAQKFIPPKLKTFLGSKADTASVSVQEAISLIALPLTIIDDKNNNYSVNSYQCLYTRKAVTEDEETGKVSPVSSLVAQNFKSTPLSSIWQSTIAEQLKSGEEIFFFDIVVKNAQGRLFFAPNLKLIVQ